MEITSRERKTFLRAQIYSACSAAVFGLPFVEIEMISNAKHTHSSKPADLPHFSCYLLIFLVNLSHFDL